jgi:hypothetical protein
MQKLSAKLKNTPEDTPLVLCSVSSNLKESKDSVIRTKYWLNNNLEVVNSQYIGKQDLRVFV